MVRNIFSSDIVENVQRISPDFSTVPYLCVNNDFDTVYHSIFSQDGSKLYILGTELGEQYKAIIKQYNLSTPYEISTASYNSQKIIPFGTTCRQMYLTADGTKLIVLSALNSSSFILQYNLSTPYKISTAIIHENGSYFHAQSKLTTTFGPYPSYCMSASGQQLFIGVGTSIHVFNMSTPYDTVNAVYVSSFTNTSFSANYGFCFNADGTKIYFSKTTNISATITLSTAWDLTSFTGATVVTDGTNTYLSGDSSICFSADGFFMYKSNTTNDNVRQYSLTTPYDINTSSLLYAYSISAQSTSNSGITFKLDGTRMYINTLGKISEYNLSTPWNISTTTFNYDFVLSVELNSFGICFDNIGKYMFIGDTNGFVNKYRLGTYWQTSTAYREDNIFNSTDNHSCLVISADGSKMFLGDSSIYEFSINNFAVDNTASFVKTSTKYSFTKFSIENDGKQLYCFDSTGTNKIKKYELQTPWNVDIVKNQVKSDSVVLNGTSTVFSKNGLNYYVINANTDLYRYTLSTPFDISTFTYHSTVNLNNLYGSCNALSINDAGTKILISTNAGTYITEFNLTTPYDINTLVKVKEFSNNCFALFCNGSNLYIAETSTSIRQYLLNSDHEALIDTNVGTMYVGDVSSNIGDISFSTDGSKLYLFDSGTDYCYQYNLSTAWDMRTCTYTGKSKYLRNVYRISFNDVGTKLIGYLGFGGVYQYNLSTAWDISTCTLSSEINYDLDLYTLSSTRNSMYFSSTGNKVFLSGLTNNGEKVINCYDLSANFDLSTAAKSINAYIDFTNYNLINNSMEFDSTGSYLFLTTQPGVYPQYLYKFSLSSAYNISSAQYHSKMLITVEKSITRIKFNSAGTKLYLIGVDNDKIYTYNLSSPYDIVNNFSTTLNKLRLNITTNATGMHFSNNGYYMYFIDDAEYIIQCYLSTAYDTGTIYNVKKKYIGTLGAGETSLTGIYVKSDGTKMFLCGNASDKVFEFSMVNYDVDSVKLLDSMSIFGIDISVGDIKFSTDGSKMFMVGSSGDTVACIVLNTPWSIVNGYASFVETSISAFETTSTGLDFSSDGSYLFIVGSSSDKVWKITLAAPWDISSVATRVSLSISTYETSATGLYVTSDKIFVNGNLYLNEYTMTNYDIVNAVYKTSNDFSIATKETLASTLCFSNDGTKVYVAGLTHAVYQFSLSTAWDISTMNFVQSKDFGTKFCTDILFSSDGAILLVLDYNSNCIYQFILGTAWDISSTNALFFYKTETLKKELGTPCSFAYNNNGSKLFVMYRYNSILQYSINNYKVQG